MRAAERAQDLGRPGEEHAADVIQLDEKRPLVETAKLGEMAARTAVELLHANLTHSVHQLPDSAIEALAAQGSVD